jgi:hypothetical protein
MRIEAEYQTVPSSFAKRLIPNSCYEVLLKENWTAVERLYTRFETTVSVNKPHVVRCERERAAIAYPRYDVAFQPEERINSRTNFQKIPIVQGQLGVLKPYLHV